MRIVRAEDPVPPDSRARRLTHYLIAAGVYLVLAGLFIHDWDGFVFENSVRDFWAGKTPYRVAEEQPFYTFLNVQDSHPQWYAYPPLPLLAMSLTFIPEVLWNVPPFAERILIKLPMVLGTLFVAYVGEAWARQLQKPPETIRRVRTLLLFNPFLILIGPVWGMTDASLIGLFLFGALRYQQRKPVQAGVLMGLAALIKPFPVLLALPVAAYFLYEQGWKPLGRMVAAAATTCLAVCLPFLLTTPRGFIQQIALFHLARPVQGLSVWRLVPPGSVSNFTVEVLSFTLMAVSLLCLAFLAPRIRSPAAPILITLAAAVEILFWNRVVNDQYLVMVVAPLLMLAGLGQLESATGRVFAKVVPAGLALFTVVIGWHFLTFIPPDIALPIFRVPVDVVAENIRRVIRPMLERLLLKQPLASAIFAAGLAGNAILSYRFARRWLPALGSPEHRPLGELHTRAYAVSATTLLVLLAVLPVGTPDTADHHTEVAADERPLVGAFYYLWWNNPSHDPSIRYGNWLKVSQTPEMGYYTNTRAVARDHVRMMLQNGIDVAVVSYHTGELERLQVFMDEAAQQGLLVAPLIELNQIYDQADRHALGPDGVPVPHAAYRIDNDTRVAIEDFVLQLSSVMTPSAPLYRVDGRPAIFFYDSYVSAISYDEPSKRILASELLQSFPIDTLRVAFNDSDMRPTIDDALGHFPDPHGPLLVTDNPSKAFYEGERTRVPGPTGMVEINQSAYWRIAHLNLHRDFWLRIRHDVESKMGPLFLVSGEAFNERAGFEAGVVKGFVANDAFDGSFIYSPSFVWGNHPRDGDGHLFNSYDEVFRSWEDRNIWLNAATSGGERFSAYGIAPAYDDTVNRQGLVHSKDPNATPRSQGFVIPAFPEGDPTYDRMWKSAIRFRPSLVLVATFNEFFEGSSIEPSVEFGDQFMLKTKQYHELLNATPVPDQEVVVIAHERSSRTNPFYSEADRPHVWGLRLTAAATRAFANANVVELDALDPDPEPRARPAMLIIDGGRDGYDDATISPEIQAMVDDWVGRGVPTLILGREVAQPVRDLVAPQCGANEVLPLGHAVVPEELADDDDQLDAGDRLVLSPGQPGFVQLERRGDTHVAGYRCPQQTNVAFLGVKPWGPEGGWILSQPADERCLGLIASALVPSFTGLGDASLDCTIDAVAGPKELPAGFSAPLANGERG